MNTLQIKNKQAKKTAQEILDRIEEIEYDNWSSDGEDLYFKIISMIDNEFLFKS